MARDWKDTIRKASTGNLHRKIGISDEDLDQVADPIGLWDPLLKNPDDTKALAEAERARKEAAYQDLSAPELADLEFQDYEWQGDLTPEEIAYQDIASAQQGESEMSNISMDPRLRTAQMGALESLQDVAQSGGMTQADQANLARIQSQTGEAARGRRGAIQQQMQQRGMGGSGMELLAQLQGNQAATNQSAQMGLDVAGMAQDRALQAMQMGGNMGGNIRSQDWGEQSQQAQAQDAINRFNTSNTQQSNQFNAQNQMTADQYNANQRADTNRFNVQGQQGISNQNVDSGNQQQQYNQNLEQQRYDNSVAQTDRNAGVYSENAANLSKQAADETKAKANMVGNVVKVGATAMSDERVKNHIDTIPVKDVEEFFDAVKPKSYNYNDSEHGEGRRLGLMLQDVQDTKLGKAMIRPTDGGYMAYDKDNLMGIMLAGIAMLHRKGM